MGEKRKSYAIPILTALATVPLFLLAAYIGCYFWLGSYRELPHPQTTYILRTYRYRWQAELFMPAARVEEHLHDCAVRPGFKTER